MSRTIGERMQDPLWWGEQALHFIILGGAPVVLFLWSLRKRGPALAGFVLAAAVAVAREATQLPIESWADTIADILFTAVGGGVVGWACGLAWKELDRT